MTTLLKLIDKIKPENVEYKLHTSFCEKMIYMDIVYKNKFSIKKQYPNTLAGKDQLEEDLKQYSTEEEIKKYFGIK